MTNETIEHKVMDVLSTIFEGDMIQVWAAYITIFDNGLKDVDIEAIPDVENLAAELYGRKD
jgi:hypothetical protein